MGTDYLSHTGLRTNTGDYGRRPLSIFPISEKGGTKQVWTLEGIYLLNIHLHKGITPHTFYVSLFFSQERKYIEH